jgi:hypothetical protein
MRFMSLTKTHVQEQNAAQGIYQRNSLRQKRWSRRECMAEDSLIGETPPEKETRRRHGKELEGSARDVVNERPCKTTKLIREEREPI